MEPRKDLYLYFHFPFCKKKCDYCDFYSICELDKISSFSDAILIESDQHSELISQSNIKTIYFGGGSPNLLSTNKLYRIISKLGEYNSLNKIEEFTIEINPGEISKEVLLQFRDCGVNRISIGSQSFSDKDLQFLGRIHDSSQIFKTIEMVNNAGIDNISLDLIYGIPHQDLNGWKDNLEKAVSTNVNHFSFYNLIYEEGTKLTKKRNQFLFETVNEDIEFEMFKLAHDQLRQNNYQHYEISNWSKPGKQSIHNSAYWSGDNYLGIGPSAHSFINGKRWRNCRSVDTYNTKLNQGLTVIENIEILDDQKIIAETLMLGLRTSTGLSISKFEEVAELPFNEILDKINRKFNNTFVPKFAELNNNYLVLSLDGWFICDYIVEQIFEITKEIKYDYKKDF